MIITTTPTLEGHTIVEYKGVVHGEAIFGINFITDTFASLHDFFGGRSEGYEEELHRGQQAAMQEMEERATKLGANAIVGMDLNFETVGPNGTMLMINACGTAVVMK